MGEAPNPVGTELVPSGDETYKYCQDRENSSVLRSISSNQKPNKIIQNYFFTQWEETGTVAALYDVT